MKLLIVSAAPFILKEEKCFAYSPYVKELIIWVKYAKEVSFCCPVWKTQNGLLVDQIPFEIKKHFIVVDFNLNNFINVVKAFFYAFLNVLIIFKAMSQADHIHLRCPGNIGLLGCLVQILFPNKPKTAKYAGNWDPNAIQPWSYRFQKWILANTFLTRNIQVLVYGEWERSSKNIKPFFTATYFETDKVPIKDLNLEGKINFVFVGTLVKGKNPLYAIQLVEDIYKKGYTVSLELYGEGIERKTLEQYINSHNLGQIIKLNGNQNQETITNAYKKSHFVILPSKSEGWPKAVAEGMFWGCVPIVTPVSCLPYMLNNGDRGILLQITLEKDIQQLEVVLANKTDFKSKRINALNWSRKYTIDVFENEIKKMLK